MTIEAELRVPAATAQLVPFIIPEPADNVPARDQAYWLDLASRRGREMHARAIAIIGLRPLRADR